MFELLLHHPRLRPLRRRAGRLRRRAHATASTVAANFRQRLAGPVAPTSGAASELGDRLVPSPIFVLSSVRSGSTLLRVLLNSHPQINAPHELHLRKLRVELGDKQYVERAVEALELNTEELEHLLWDRVLHRELQRSGKPHVVDKTPGNVFCWPRLKRCWPQARFIFLLRHPASMVDSLMRGRADRDYDETVKEVGGYVKALDNARKGLPGLVVRYEDLADDPRGVTRKICRFIGVSWDEQMLNYGEHDHGTFRAGIGDWSAKIRSGKIQQAQPLPSADQVPAKLRDAARAWGYLD